VFLLAKMILIAVVVALSMWSVADVFATTNLDAIARIAISNGS